MLPLASIFGEFAAGSGGIAAAIAVSAFLGQIVPALTGGDELRIRRGAAIGGLGGICVVFIVVVLSAIFS